jgi:putative peptidoglycan lipid II flippase
VSPMSNSLLPEIARLRTLGRLREAFRLIDRTVALAGLVAVGGCAFALALREPAIRLLFERGSFTASSTAMVAAVYLGLAPSVIGWALIELSSRSLFSVGHGRLPAAVAFIPLLINAAITLGMGAMTPQLLGVGASLGLLAGFVILYVLAKRRRSVWLAEPCRRLPTR